MSKLKYSLGIILAVVLIAAGAVYIYFAHYAPLKPDEATEVTVWYVNNDKMWQNFAGLADNYSSGEGKKYGITVKVKAFDSRTELYKDLNKAIEETRRRRALQMKFIMRLIWQTRACLPT